MESMPLRIFTFHDTPRLRYIAGILLGEILGLQWEITSDRRKIKKCPVINYSDVNIDRAFRIVPDGMLSEKGIFGKDIKVETWNNLPVYFTNNGGDIPFDIFSASFYLVSRYEEYLDNEPDSKGRFRFSSSIAFRNGFLGIPVVDLWTKEMAKALLKKFRTLTFRRNEFRSVIIVDSDQASSNGSGTLFNSLGNIAGRLAGKHRKSAGSEPDILDSFGYLVRTAGQNSIDLKFFFPVGDHSRYDKNPSWKNADYRNLITEIAAKSQAGLYSSYFSHEKKLVKDETGRMEKILGHKVILNRFHSQRFFLPHSFRMLLDGGIKEDYSMGYPDEPGFRAGIARSFCFYDLPNEKQTDLRIFPFQFVDDYLLTSECSSEEKMKVIGDLIDRTRVVGGLFISAWHVHGFHSNGHGNDLRNLFEFMINYQRDDSLS